MLVADSSAWFQYYWWREADVAPPYATEMDMHEELGFDPCERFFGDSRLASLEPSKVGGFHGRVDDVPALFGLGGPTTENASLSETIDASVVTPILADLLGIIDSVTD